MIWRRKLWRWLADTVPAFLDAIWHGDTQKAAILAAILVTVLLFLIFTWLWFWRHPQVSDESATSEEWQAPSLEEVGKVINGTKH